MPGRNGGVHQSGRRRGIVRVIADGNWYGMGPEVEDAVSGWSFPKRLMTKQRTGLISYRLSDGSLDLDKTW